jgi:protein-S-isoprenylcysteine O-methyltransferase Ste14
MIGIALGAAAFLLIFWVDLVSLKGLGVVKPVLWLAGGTLFVVGVVQTIRNSTRVPLPAAVPVLGWILFGVFALFFLYSLFFEIPFASAYVKKGTPARLVTSGTYALCRHPAVLWFAALLAGLFLGTGAMWLLPAILVWTGLDVLYIVLQEKLFFVPMFGTAYKEYQGKVPMLIPTSRSVRECVRTIFEGRM